MVIREFLTRLAFNADDAKVRKFDRAISVLRTGLVAVVGAATAASAAAIKMAGDTARYGDELAKTARRLGINVDALEGLRFAAERSGVAQNTLEMALQRMTRRLSEAAAGGGEAQKAIQELGLDAQALGNMAPEEAMNVLADALSGVENQSDRVRLAFKFFDSEGVALLNMLDQGSAGLKEMDAEFRRLSGGLTGPQAKAAEAYSDALTNMQMAFEGLRLQIGAKLMPVLQPLIEGFTEFLVINRELILERVHRTFEILIGVMRSLMRMVSRAWSVIDGIAQAFGGWDRTMRLAEIAIKGIIGLTLAKWLTGVKGGISAIARILSFGFLAKWGIWGLAIAAAALALDDFLTWIEGGDSVIGSILGPVADFVDSLGDLDQIATAIVGIALAKWAWGVSAAMFAAALSIGAVNAAMAALKNHPLMRLLTILMHDPQAPTGLSPKQTEPGWLDKTLGADEGETLGTMLRRKLGLDAKPPSDAPSESTPEPAPLTPEQSSTIPEQSSTIIEGATPMAPEIYAPPLPKPEPSPFENVKRYLDELTKPENQRLPESETVPREDIEFLTPSALEDIERFLNQSSMPAGPSMPPASEVNHVSNVVHLDAPITVTAAAGTTTEQGEQIATRIRTELSREINRAGTALET